MHRVFVDRRALYLLLQPESRVKAARSFRAVHHAVVLLGIAIMIAVSVDEIEAAYASGLALGFELVVAFFFAEYLLRLYVAPEAPGGEHRGPVGSRLAWATSPGGLIDLAATIPAFIALGYGRDGAAFGFLWAFKFVRFIPGLASLGRVVANARHALASVLIGFGIVLLTAASFAYLLERDAHPDHPEAFGTIPAALWWGIVTMSTTGYGDIVPKTIAGRFLSAVVMMSGILVFALWTGIIVNGYAAELRRRDFLRTWDLVARVPFFRNAAAGLIAEVTHLLRPRYYPQGAVIMRRGEPGDCMFFIVEGQVEVRLPGEPVFLDAGGFFGELALLTRDPRNATVAASQACTLLALDIVDFHELLGREPGLAKVIREEARRRADETASAAQ